MALKNHARQENSYIPSERLRSKFSKNARYSNNIDDGTISHETATIKEEVTQSTKESPPGFTGTASQGGLMQFKSAMNINLKITLEDDNDWGKVSWHLQINSC